MNVLKSHLRITIETLLRGGATQRDIGDRVFRLAGDAAGWLLSERPAGSDGWVPVFRFSETPHALTEFTSTCRWQETESPLFTGHRIAEIATAE